jgi:hypothetical protein
MTKAKIKELCKKHGATYHHHDEFKTPRYKSVDLASAVIVVYPSEYGSWVLAVNEDGSVSRPGDQFEKKVKDLQGKIERFLDA